MIFTRDDCAGEGRLSLLDDRGGITTQLVVVIPLVLLLILLIVQFAPAWHAQHIAQYAAERGLAAARAKDATAATGQVQARATPDVGMSVDIAQLGARVLTGPSVTVEGGREQAAVRAGAASCRSWPACTCTPRARRPAPSKASPRLRELPDDAS